MERCASRPNILWILNSEFFRLFYSRVTKLSGEFLMAKGELRDDIADYSPVVAKGLSIVSHLAPVRSTVDL
jgi:hypothetical protein